MAEFLTTTGISSQLEEIIKSANERLWLISPFLKVTPRIKELLEEKANPNSNVNVCIIYGKRDLKREEDTWLKSLTSVEIRFRESLHAKCYFNEDKALITSMNLYEFSQVNNDEMGILVSSEMDSDIYNEILGESERIKRNSKLIQEGAKPKALAKGKERAAAKVPPRRFQPSTGVPTYGFCIRCKVDLRAKPTQPYCNSCYATWKRYSNPEYEENNCHICGNEYGATLLKPLCVACYRTYKDIFEFATS